jgi:GNAT superfamily N-acetyltransferase
MPILVRDAGPDDVPDLRRLAAAVGQDHEWAAGDERYLRHLLVHGRLLVAEYDGRITGYAGTRPLQGDRRVSMLTDLFVHPSAHGRGLGGAMLSALWDDEPERMTFSSLHPAALPLYTRFGLSAHWPLLYLSGPTAGLGDAPGLTVVPCAPERAAALEEAWSGLARPGDHLAWAGRPGGSTFVVTGDGEELAVGASAHADPPDTWVLEHLSTAPGAGEDTAAAVVQAALGVLTPAATVRLPAPHPAVRALLERGWQVSTYDLFMATDRDLLDPRRVVPSPALA